MGPKVLAGKSWEGRTTGGKSPCGSTFSDHPMDNLRKEIRRISIRILRLTDKRPYSVSLKIDFLLQAGFLWVQIKIPERVKE